MAETLVSRPSHPSIPSQLQPSLFSAVMVEIKSAGTSEPLEPWLAASQLGVRGCRKHAEDNKVAAQRSHAAHERRPHERGHGRLKSQLSLEKREDS